MNEYIDQIETWYLKNKRDLPWRRDQEPYHVWISEIMLQQTRIEAVIGYYERFMKEIPSISALAIISEDRLLKLWEGLGYYNRARNLKRAAIMIEEQYGGVFPSTYDEIIQLPGIGDYTASAISSICFKEKQATIDGNVLRVYTRFYNDFSNVDVLSVRRRIQREIIAILPEDSGSFNEALMEIGEVICIPNGNPLCDLCPLQKGCMARKKNTYFDLPIKKEKKIKKEILYTVFLFQYEDTFVIEKRGSLGILSNMWQFPNVEGHLTLQGVKTYLNDRGICYHRVRKGISYQHIFTHQKWNMISYLIELKQPMETVMRKRDCIMENYAIPTAFQPFLKAIMEEDKK